jgi:hypothetical protein
MRSDSPMQGSTWSYCGLVKHEKFSGGRSYGRRKGRYSRVLKSVYKTATMVALQTAGPIREYYDHLLSRGVAERNARNAAEAECAK